MNRDALRKEIVNFVGEKRLPHVLGTEKECLELAGIFGMSDTDREKLAFVQRVTGRAHLEKDAVELVFHAGRDDLVHPPGR